MNCQKCGKPNRSSAKYCKWCGQSLAAASAAGTGSPLDRLVGKDNLRRDLDDIFKNVRGVAAQGKALGEPMRLNMCFAITGASGLGKKFLAETITAALYAEGIVSDPNPYVVRAIDFDEFTEKLADNIKTIGNNVLVIENAQRLCPNERAETNCDLDKILDHCEEWSDDPSKPIVIMLGDEDLDMFFACNPSAKAHVHQYLRLSAPTIADLTEICCRRLADKYKKVVDDDTRGKISRVITAAKRDNVDNFTYGNFAEQLADRINAESLNHPATAQLEPAMVPGKEFIPKTLADVMAEFDKFVGVDDIKEAIRQIALTVDEVRQRRGDAAAQGSVQSHFLFIGNPGTGKTTMARLFADALSAMGALPSGHLVEVDREKLVSQYVGETPKLVRKAVSDAMGGVLFIDEAYALCRDKDDTYGKEAVDTLLVDCENLRGKFVCIMAGYPLEMKTFMGSNSGLPRRFNKTINFRDYTGPELTRIFRNMAARHKDGPFILSPEVDEQIGSYFDKMYAKRGDRFGNAGTVRNELDAAVGRMRSRLDKARQNGTFTPDMADTLIMADIQDDVKSRQVSDILSSLDDLIGMSGVRKQIETIAKSVRLNQRKLELGRGKVQVDNYHLIITGNPGTGKTTVAMRLGQVFKALGVLPTDTVVVRKKEDILSSYANSAGPNMRKAVDDAMGGILFIDEAYSLLPTGTPGTVNADGAAAIEALMTCMSERPGQFITVMAGYKTEMDEFIRNANAGLARRFTHTIHIDDYSCDDLFKIYMQQVDKGGYIITDEAQERLRTKIEEIVTAKDEKFGNAGTMIKLFNETLERQSNRVDIDADDDALFTIEKEDIPYDAPRKLDMDQIMAELDKLEGLAAVKNAIRDLAATLEMEIQRAKAEGKNAHINLSHYLFLGNPGTGKTTVARLMGDIFYSLGLLPSNKVIELTAKDLKAPYVGQTAPKANAAMMRGMGGVVFIDEAYAITQGEGEGGFGKEAVAEILKVMEDKRNKFITIAAGYPKEMQEFLDTNSGFESRFGAPIMFEDYSADELTRIALKMFASRKVRLTDAAAEALQREFVRMTTHRSKNFANAREARKLVDAIFINQGRRLREESKMPDYDRDRLFVIEAADIINQ